METANIYFNGNELEKAKQFYLQSLGYKSGNEEALTKLAEIYKKQNNKIDAFLCLQ